MLRKAVKRVRRRLRKGCEVLDEEDSNITGIGSIASLLPRVVVGLEDDVSEIEDAYVKAG